jgi:Domain of unknown function (DUF4397)
MRLRLRTTVSALLLVATSISCDGRASGMLVTAPVNGVSVRLLNALTSAPSLSFVVDAQVASSAVGFGSASPYVPVTLGSHRLQAQASNTGTTLVDFTRDLNSQGAFSLIPAPGLSQFGALFIQDNPTAPAGQATLRVVHVAAAPGAVSVYVTAPTTDLSSVSPVIPILVFAASSDYAAVTPGTYRVRITRVGAPGTVLVDSGNLTVVSGSVRTLLLTDAPGGGLPTALSIIADAN